MQQLKKNSSTIRNPNSKIITISIIAAMSINRVIGKNNHIPWKIPGELKRFKGITMGHTVIMGRKTHQSIGKPLPGRTNIVITRQDNYAAPGCRVVKDLEQALHHCPASETEAFIIGGEQIFRLALPITHRIYLTTIQQPIDGDTYFPNFSLAEFKPIKTEFIDAKPPYTFTIFERTTGFNP